MKSVREQVAMLLMASSLVYAGSATAFGFNMGDSFGEGFDFNEGNDLDIGGSRMSWDTPDNVWDTGTSTGKGFSWGGGPRSAPNWGFRDAPPPAYWGMPPQYSMPYYPPAPGYRPQPYYGQPPAPQIYQRPPAPPAPAAAGKGGAQ